MKSLSDYEPLVRSIVSRIVQRESVSDDLVQETFLRALESRPLGLRLARDVVRSALARSTARR